MNRFLVVCVGLDNAADEVERCLESVCTQTDPRVEPAVIVDRPEDRKYALANQVAAWRMLDPTDEDVVVFVDLDDRLARPDALEIVRRHYDAGALLTYGSYRAVPEGHPDAASCRPARPYPAHVRLARAYRTSRPQWFNHLRTVSWKLLKHLTEEDLRDDAGGYWRANTDRAVMFPCLELAGDRVAVIPEVLYEYTCDSPAAVWRTMRRELVREDHQLARRPRKPIAEEAR